MTPRRTLASFRRVANQRDEQIAEVSMTRRSEVRTPPDHVPKAGQKLNQQRHRIGFRVWFHQGDELTR